MNIRPPEGFEEFSKTEAGDLQGRCQALMHGLTTIMAMAMAVFPKENQGFSTKGHVFGDTL